MPDVRAFLERYMGKPMVWGTDDCSLVLADWWRECHGMDPAAHLRGTYSDEKGKAAIVAQAGGLLPLVTSIADAAGAQRVLARHDGDFGVVLVGNKMVSGILVRRYWAIRAEDGITFTSGARAVRVWSP